VQCKLESAELVTTYLVW